MCGIFGVLITEKNKESAKKIGAKVNDLFVLSESRGKESSGIACLSDGVIRVHKQPIPASCFIKSDDYRAILATALESNVAYPKVFIGHARLVTNGSLEISQNNQPVIKDGIVGVHNGIITNDKQLWDRFPSLKRTYDVDTEIALALIRMFLKKGESIPKAVSSSFQQIEGTASLALLFDDKRHLALATNNGSLYVYVNKEEGLCAFASEKYILQSLIAKGSASKDNERKIFQVEAGSGYVFDCYTADYFRFSFQNPNDFHDIPNENRSPSFVIEEISAVKGNTVPVQYSMTSNLDAMRIRKDLEFYFSQTKKMVDGIRRCTQCVLPESMPFIEFDERGICNYCAHYRQVTVKGENDLFSFVDSYRNDRSEYDCLVPLSGGRDSCYALHYVKNVLGLKPISFSYDWGMITDLGRRNQARMCGKLGVEHIVVSADIRKKREHIRKNVSAWLKKPDLGMIPIFMAGDKEYFYHMNRLQKQLDVKLVVYSENPLEKTDFKSGFCGVPPKFDVERSGYDLGLLRKTALGFYYLRHYLENPSYFNSSITDTVQAYFSSYFIPHDYLYLYRYIQWDENTIQSTLINEYHWEVSKDTKSTWRIGDGTAAFYNYIYYTVAGFTENDTFRSNQVREGVITREDALRLLEEDNCPRYDSIIWYCDTIGIHCEDAIRKIQGIPKKFSMKYERER